MAFDFQNLCVFEKHSKVGVSPLIIYCFDFLKGYIAPAKIDPKLLDPRHIFKDVEPEGKKKISILQVEVNVHYFVNAVVPNCPSL